MNQEKIGKLIAKIRKEKGLTQQQLGDMVGVGYRAVSKWETGLTLPDISIINELCEILGITSDELLKGELHKKESSPKTKRSPLIWLILIPIIIGIIAIIYIIKQNNKEYIYNLESDISDCRIEGIAIFKGSNLKLNINKITFYNYELNETVINDYRYKVTSGEKVLFAVGYGISNDNMVGNVKISDLTTNLTINYFDKIDISKNEIIKDGINLEFIFTTTDNNEIKKEIEIIIIESPKDDSTN